MKKEFEIKVTFLYLQKNLLLLLLQSKLILIALIFCIIVFFNTPINLLIFLFVLVAFFQLYALRVLRYGKILNIVLRDKELYSSLGTFKRLVSYSDIEKINNLGSLVTIKLKPNTKFSILFNNQKQAKEFVESLQNLK